MRLVEVRLVQCGAAQACYQPIIGQVWQSWGLGEEEGVEGVEGKTHHYHRTCSVWLWWRGCGAVRVCVCTCRGRGGWSRSGWVFDSIPLPPSSGDHTLFVLYFCTTWLADFFFLNIFPPLSPSSRCVSGVLARQERQNSCGSAEQFPINQGIMQAGNSNKMQMSGGARLQPNTSPSPEKKKPDRSLQTAA